MPGSERLSTSATCCWRARVQEEEIMTQARSVAPAEARSVLRASRATALDSFDQSKATALAAILRRNRTSLVPTLSVNWTTLSQSRRDGRIAQRLRYVPAAYRAEWAGEGLGEAAAAEFRRMLEVVGVLHRAGVEVLAGTDVVKGQFIPGFSLHDELSLLVTAGLSPMEAIEAATRKPARMLGYNNVGTVEPGMQADLVLLDADPLDNIENSRRITSVMTAGRLFDRQALDAMLEDVEREATRWHGTPTAGPRPDRRPGAEF
jgi:imidazolonepropionase-like amidohydrolase